MKSISNRKHLLVVFSTLALLLSACRKETKADFHPDYFIVGSSYGMCLKGCTDLYKLSGGQLYADSMERGLLPLVFLSKPLDDSKRKTVSDLQSQVPATIYEGDTIQQIGCPDCHDQGTYYLEFAKGGMKFTVRLDTDSAAIPVELRSFHAQMEQALSNLKK